MAVRTGPLRRLNAASNGERTRPEPELDHLSNILRSFNEEFGTLFTDADRVARRINGGD